MIIDGLFLQSQQRDMSCWAASIAMIVGWRDSMSISEDSIAQQCGCITELDTGLSSTNLIPLRYFGFEIVYPTMCFAPSAFVNAMDKHGPLWIAAYVPSPHIRVAGGYSKKSNGSYNIRIYDPGPTGIGQIDDIDYGVLARQQESYGGTISYEDAGKTFYWAYIK